MVKIGFKQYKLTEMSKKNIEETVNFYNMISHLAGKGIFKKRRKKDFLPYLSLPSRIFLLFNKKHIIYMGGVLMGKDLEAQLGGTLRDEFKIFVNSSKVGGLLPSGAHPDYRGQSIGKRMDKYRIKYLQKQKCKYIVANISPKNQNRINSFKKLGFIITGEFEKTKKYPARTALKLKL